jgi:hypothetical protein
MKIESILSEMAKQQKNEIINKIRTIIDKKGSSAIDLIRKNIKLKTMDEIGEILSVFNDKVLQRVLYQLERL